MTRQRKEITEYILKRLRKYHDLGIDFSNQTVAKEIVKEYYTDVAPQSPEYVKLVNRVRDRIRYYRGSQNKYNRKKRRGEFLAYRDPSKAYEYILKFTRKGLERQDSIFEFPSTCKRVLILSDIHFPFHDLECIHKALEYGLNKEMDTILLNGDIVDFYDISRWSKGGERVSMTEEKGMLVEFLEYLKGFNVPIYYKYGNHEARWEYYINRQIPELSEDRYFALERYLGLNELDIKVIQSRTLMKLGKLNVIHGHEFGETVFSPVNPARGLFLRAKASVLAGHYHQPSYHSESDLNGSTVGCWSTGCLSHLNPTYRPFAYTKWRHGFAFVEVEKNGSFHVHNKVIVDGNIM